MSVSNVNAAITLLLNLTAAAGEVSNLIARASDEGRDLTDEELLSLQQADARARQRLMDAIAKADTQGG